MHRVLVYIWPALAGILFVCCLWLWQQSGSPAPATTARLSSFAAAVNSAKESVVSITTIQQVMYSNRRGTLQNSRLGSAVIVDEAGYLLTSNHVINGADDIIITLFDGRTAHAEIIGIDKETDLAVLWISLDNLRPIRFGQMKDVEVGDIVLAIGNPFGFGHSVTQGIISATGRWGMDPDNNRYENYLQTDADINVGNSGGALVDINGELVGICSAIFSHSGRSQGVGLAIPIDIAQYVMLQLIQQGTVVRGWLGLGVRELNTGIGAIVTNTAPGGPAYQAGIRVGDVIVAIDHQPLDSGRSGMRQVALLSPGQNIDIHVRRGSEELILPIVVGRKPPT